MQRDRDYHAAYYDLTTMGMDDIAFYARYVDPGTSVLELGCGTGRVSAVLSERARRVVGVDRSEAMLSRAQEKCSGERTAFVLDDITEVRLGERFDLIIAPFRVLQALERDAQVSAFFQTIRAHLAPGGKVILNVFNPKLEAQEMASSWVIEGENYCEEFALPGGRVSRSLMSAGSSTLGGRSSTPSLSTVSIALGCSSTSTETLSACAITTRSNSWP